MLKAELLSYYRDGYQIFSGVSFDVDIGTCMFVKGDNGSGKTTLLRLLAGYLPLQEGSITINGKRISEDPDLIVKYINYIGQFNATKKQMTAWENFNFWKSIHSQGDSTELENKFEDPMKINGYKHRPISFCSAGQIRRVVLSRLGASNRKLWLLDEPTTLLDKNAIKNFNKMIENHCLSGGLAIIATHTDLNIPKINTKTIRMTKNTDEKNIVLIDPFLSGDW